MLSRSLTQGDYTVPLISGLINDSLRHTLRQLLSSHIVTRSRTFSMKSRRVTTDCDVTWLRVERLKMTDGYVQDSWKSTTTSTLNTVSSSSSSVPPCSSSSNQQVFISGNQYSDGAHRHLSYRPSVHPSSVCPASNRFVIFRPLQLPSRVHFIPPLSDTRSDRVAELLHQFHNVRPVHQRSLKGHQDQISDIDITD